MKKNLENKVISIGNEVPFQETTELGQVFENLDADRTGKDGRSSLDFNTRLTTDQINSITVIDEFRAFGLLPPEIGITTTVKRLNISKDGEGRKEKVKIVTGEREQKSGNFIKKLFTPREG